MDDSYDPDDVGHSIVDALRADGRDEQFDPPVASPMQLPSHQLSPPMFERLVAEFALRVDGLSRIRIYGRSGQSQGGLDLLGWDSKGLTVYQVRRVDDLSAPALRKAVTDFAEPMNKGKPTRRRFEEARRFVLVTGCVVDDRKVDDELARLKAAYEGDLEIDLYDNTELSTELRYQGSLVYGIFGLAWAEAFCGYRPSSASASAPPGRAYLADPVDILGFSDVHSRAKALAAEEPGPAAEMFGSLADELDAKGFTPRARQLRRSQLMAYRDAGWTDQALSVAVGLVLANYEDGDLFPGRFEAELGGADNPETQPLIRVTGAIARWFEHGYDLAPIVEDLTRLLETSAPYATTLLLTVAEQVLADDHPHDDHEPLLSLLTQWAETASGLGRSRLMCCAADFRVWSGMPAADAFRELTRLAFAGHVDADQAAFINRRCGRALVPTDPDAAADHYRRAVLDASDSGLGGDLRDALRSLAFLANVGDRLQSMEAARSVTDRARLLEGVDRIVINALESLAEDKLPQALRSTHDWVRRERVNGALMDEVVALRRYGTVFNRAGEYSAATRSLIRGGARKEAKKSAVNASSNYVDVGRYLEPRQLTTVHEAAAASVAQQADYVPDEQVEELCGRLLELVGGIGTEQLFTSQASIEALRALAAFGRRLPEDIGAQLLANVEPLIERGPGRYRYCDAAMLDLFTACAEHPATDLAERGVAGLVRCIDQEVHRADARMRGIERSDRAIELLLPLAEEDNRAAIELLAAWDVVTAPVRSSALTSARQLLERPVSQPRSTWTLGTGAQGTAIQLRAALKSNPADPELVEVRDRLADHLLRWAEDEHDIAESRSDAVHSIRILSSEFPAQTRAAAFDRLLALHDEPRFSRMDQMHQESLHPLSRFQFGTGSPWFSADCLFAAAVLAEDTDRRNAVWSRVTDRLTDSQMPKEVAESLGRAARCLSEMQTIDIRGLAPHPQPVLRQTAVICWINNPDRDPAYASHFVRDDNWVVRANLAHAIRSLEPHAAVYDTVVQQLKQDPNRQVRDLVGDV